MNSARKPFWIALGIAAIAILYVGSVYNGLVGSSESVKSAWAQVETQYQRRFDLVPNLVRTVQGAAQFEQSTITAVTQARSGWQGAGSRQAQIAAARAFDSALSRLLVTVEAYPQLQATQSFRDLMTQLEGTENRIGVARKYYNDAVQGYNVRVKRFPTNVLASMFGFAPETFFESTEGSDTAPAVDFGTSSSL